MGHKKTSDKVFTRRAVVIGGLQLAGISVLSGRLAWLQITQGKKYKTMSDKNRIDIEILPPIRGLIVDTNGSILAENSKSFSLFVTPSKANNLETALGELHKVVDVPDGEIAKIIKKASSQPSFVPIKVKGNLQWGEVARISVRIHDMPWFSVEDSYVRKYPTSANGAHIVGYVGSVNKSDLANSSNSKLLSVPDFKIGKTGIELSQEKNLRGAAGAAQVEVDARGRRIREVQRDYPKQGSEIELTINAKLQKEVMHILSGQKSASAVVVDVKTGALKASVSYPSFNPNEFVTGLSAATWEGLLADSGHPMTNKAIAGLYPPASTFKMITALAALNSKVIDEHSHVTCKGYMDYGGHRYHCWKRGGHGTVDLNKSLEQSCDIFFYNIALKLGIDEISSMAHRFGFGTRFGIGLNEEGVGLMPDKKWKMGEKGSRWTTGESISASIGQGYIQATPLQMAVMTARIASISEKSVSPFLISRIDGSKIVKPEFLSLGVDTKYLDLVRKGMISVVLGSKGTARRSRIVGKDWQMAGKTGTAQVRRITAAQRAAGVNNADLPWEHRHHALFTGYAPIKSPRYACCVVVEHGVGGSTTAAPISRDILIKAMDIKS